MIINTESSRSQDFMTADHLAMHDQEEIVHGLIGGFNSSVDFNPFFFSILVIKCKECWI